MDPRLPTDEVLLQLIAQRDTHALEVLYDRHAQVIYNLILRIVRDPAVADELLQDVFWQVWRKAEQYRAGGAPTAWLYRIARNKSLDELRRAGGRRRDWIAPLDADLVASDAAGPALGGVEQIAERAWLRRDVRRALATLPVEQRRCLELAYFDGLSQRQIAELSRTPVGTVKTRIRLGLEKLALILRSAGFELDDVQS